MNNADQVTLYPNCFLGRNFLLEAEATRFEEALWNELPWIQHDDAPRRECWMNDFGLPYTYGRDAGRRTYDPAPWHPIVEEIRQKLFGLLSVHFDGCFINGYADESQALGWHSDDSPEIDPARPIAIVSLGAERLISFRPAGVKGDPTHQVSMPSGSLVMMHAFSQQTWAHKIPKHDRPCGRRISLTYRGYLAPENAS